MDTAQPAPVGQPKASGPPASRATLRPASTMPKDKQQPSRFRIIKHSKSSPNIAAMAAAAAADCDELDSSPPPLTSTCSLEVTTVDDATHGSVQSSVPDPPLCWTRPDGRVSKEGQGLALSCGERQLSDLSQSDRQSASSKTPKKAPKTPRFRVVSEQFSADDSALHSGGCRSLRDEAARQAPARAGLKRCKSAAQLPVTSTSSGSSEAAALNGGAAELMGSEGAGAVLKSMSKDGLKVVRQKLQEMYRSARAQQEAILALMLAVEECEAGRKNRLADMASRPLISTSKGSSAPRQDLAAENAVLQAELDQMKQMCAENERMMTEIEQEQIDLRCSLSEAQTVETVEAAAVETTPIPSFVPSFTGRNSLGDSPDGRLSGRRTRIDSAVSRHCQAGYLACRRPARAPRASCMRKQGHDRPAATNRTISWASFGSNDPCDTELELSDAAVPVSRLYTQLPVQSAGLAHGQALSPCLSEQDEECDDEALEDVSDPCARLDISSWLEHADFRTPGQVQSAFGNNAVGSDSVTGSTVGSTSTEVRGASSGNGKEDADDSKALGIAARGSEVTGWSHGAELTAPATPRAPQMCSQGNDTGPAPGGDLSSSCLVAGSRFRECEPAGGAATQSAVQDLSSVAPDAIGSCLGPRSQPLTRSLASEMTSPETVYEIEAYYSRKAWCKAINAAAANSAARGQMASPSCPSAGSAGGVPARCDRVQTGHACLGVADVADGAPQASEGLVGARVLSQACVQRLGSTNVQVRYDRNGICHMVAVEGHEDDDEIAEGLLSGGAGPMHEYAPTGSMPAEMDQPLLQSSHEQGQGAPAERRYPRACRSLGHQEFSRGSDPAVLPIGGDKSGACNVAKEKGIARMSAPQGMGSYVSCVPGGDLVGLPGVSRSISKSRRAHRSESAREGRRVGLLLRVNGGWKGIWGAGRVREQQERSRLWRCSVD